MKAVEVIKNILILDTFIFHYDTHILCICKHVLERWVVYSSVLTEYQLSDLTMSAFQRDLWTILYSKLRAIVTCYMFNEDTVSVKATDM